MSLLHARNLDQLRLIISQLGKNRRVFILFFGSLNSDGQSWSVTPTNPFLRRNEIVILSKINLRCPDCRESQEIVDNGVKLFLPKHGSFIRCSVGDRTEFDPGIVLFRGKASELFVSSFRWKDLNNPFRKDSDFQITNIPTLIEWRTVKMSEKIRTFSLMNNHFRVKG